METSNKKIILLIFALLTFISANAQLSAGIRDTRYVYSAYKMNCGVKFRLEHSLYSEKIGFQRIGIGVGYGTPLPFGFEWNANVFGATT